MCSVSNVDTTALASEMGIAFVPVAPVVLGYAVVPVLVGGTPIGVIALAVAGVSAYAPVVTGGLISVWASIGRAVFSGGSWGGGNWTAFFGSAVSAGRCCV